MAFASDDYCNKNPSDCAVEGKWEFGLGLGLGARSNPLVDGDAIPLVVVPQISYYGKTFFINNLDVGFTLLDKPKHMVNVIATPGFDQVFFNRTDLQNFFLPIDGGSIGNVGVVIPSVEPGGDAAVDAPELDSNGEPPIADDSDMGAVDGEPPSEVELPDRTRRVTYLSGVEWLYQGKALTLQLSYLQEITNRHQGGESRFAIAWPLGSPNNAWNISAGGTWKSEELVTYHYGEPGLLELDSAINPFVKVSYSRPIGEKWSFRALAHYELLDTAIVESPIVDEDEVVTFFAGFFYKF